MRLDCLSLNRRSSQKQLLHWSGWLLASGIGQWHGSVSSHGASPAVRNCQPNHKQEKCHSAHRQWTQPGGMETTERTGTRTGHSVWTQTQGKNITEFSFHI